MISISLALPILLFTLFRDFIWLVKQNLTFDMQKNIEKNNCTIIFESVTLSIPNLLFCGTNAI